jgi:amino acid permease
VTKGKKSGPSKRAGRDTNPFNEEAFPTACTFMTSFQFNNSGTEFMAPAAAEFFTTSSAIPVLIDEVTSIARQDSDFLENRLAMSKRIYYINVELSFILEQFRNGLLRRTQLIEEGQFLSALFLLAPSPSGTVSVCWFLVFRRRVTHFGWYFLF